MSQRKRLIDWETLAVHYRAGVRSLKDMGAEFGVSDAAIIKKARREGWTRDLKGKIQAKADKKVSAAMVSAEVSAQTKVTEVLTVEVEATIQARVRIGHRKTIARGHVLCQALLQELEDQTFDTVILGQLGELMRSPDDSGMDKLNDLYKKIISTPGRVDTAKKLIETMKSVITMEREAYGIDAIAPDANVNPMVTLLTEMRRSCLPIAYEVPRDDSL